MISLIAALALPSALAETQAVPVRLVQNADGYQLQRGGKPYLIRGAGIHNPYLEAYVRIGGNSIRTWGADNLEQLLDDLPAQHGVAAEELRVRVSVTLDDNI
jgi:hypothetical protein